VLVGGSGVDSDDVPRHTAAIVTNGAGDVHGKVGRSTQSPQPNRDWWLEWPWAPWALGAWLLAIAGVAAACGAMNVAQHHHFVPTGTWAAEAALSGLGFGILLGLFMPERPWRGEALAIPSGGSAVYAVSYLIAAYIVYRGGDHPPDNSDHNYGLVFVVFMITCLVPMIVASVIGYGLRNPRPPPLAPPPQG
jgi:hypothetical protein